MIQYLLKIQLNQNNQDYRLNRFLARCGITSRRKADGLIKNARVTVNGYVCRDSSTVITVGIDDVRVDDQRVHLQNKTTLVMNKPVGFETTMATTGKRRSIAMILPVKANNLSPVGRLDINTGGLLLFSSDGDLVYRLSHPKWSIEREYSLIFSKPIESKVLNRIRQGVTIGRRARVKPLSVERKNSKTFNIVLTTGRYHEIRRMIDTLNLRLIGLERIRYGNIKLGKLLRGKTRNLEGDELKNLYSLVDLSL